MKLVRCRGDLQPSKRERLQHDDGCVTFAQVLLQASYGFVKGFTDCVHATPF